MTAEESWECFSSEVKLLMNNFILKANNKHEFIRTLILLLKLSIFEKEISFLEIVR